MRILLTFLFTLNICLIGCESEKDRASKRIDQIDQELISTREYKERHARFMVDTTTSLNDTATQYKWRDSLYAVTDQLKKERDSLITIYFPHLK